MRLKSILAALTVALALAAGSSAMAWFPHGGGTYTPPPSCPSNLDFSQPCGVLTLGAL